MNHGGLRGSLGAWINNVHTPLQLNEDSLTSEQELFCWPSSDPNMWGARKVSTSDRRS